MQLANSGEEGALGDCLLIKNKEDEAKQFCKTGRI